MESAKQYHHCLRKREGSLQGKNRGHTADSVETTSQSNPSSSEGQACTAGYSTEDSVLTFLRYRQRLSSDTAGHVFMEVIAEGDTRVKRPLADMLMSLCFSSTFISNRNPGVSTSNGIYFTSFSSLPKITVQGRAGNMAAQEGKGKSTFYFTVKALSDKSSLPTARHKHEHFGLYKECHEILNDKRPGLCCYGFRRKASTSITGTISWCNIHVHNKTRGKETVFSRFIL